MTLMLLIGAGFALALTWCYIIAVTCCDEPGITTSELWAKANAWISERRGWLLVAAWCAVMFAIGLSCGIASVWCAK